MTSNGTSTKFATWEEARDVATAAMGDMERAQTELVASLSDSFMASTPGFLKGESVEFNTDAKGESLVDRVNAGAMTPEQAMEAAVAGGVIKGVTMQEARAIAAEVFGGQNASERAMQFRQDVEKIAVLGRNTVQNGQSRSIVNAAGNERSFLTVVEEVVEGRWKGGLGTPRFHERYGHPLGATAEAATVIRSSKAPPGRKSPLHRKRLCVLSREAISRIVVADVLGRMKDGKRIGPGTVSSGLNLNDREQSALAAILDAFRKLFRALLETASKLAKARQEGKLGGEYDAFSMRSRAAVRSLSTTQARPKKPTPSPARRSILPAIHRRRRGRMERRSALARSRPRKMPNTLLPWKLATWRRRSGWWMRRQRRRGISRHR